MTDALDLPALRSGVRAGVAMGVQRVHSAAVSNRGAVPRSSDLLVGVRLASGVGSGFSFGVARAGTHSVIGLWQVEAARFALGSAMAQPWDLLRSLDTVTAYIVNPASISLNEHYALYAHTLVTHLSDAVALPQLAVDLINIRPSEYALRKAELFTDLSSLINLDGEPYIPSGRITWGNYEFTKLPAAPMSSSSAMQVRTPAPKGDAALLPWGVGVALSYAPELPYIVEPAPLEPGEWPAPNYSEVYIIVNSVNAYALPNMEPLAIADISLDLDQDSYSWKFSADVLNASSVALLKPDASGYKEALIEINGHEWIVFIDKWGSSRKISGNALDKRFSVSGYSRTQYLGQPFAPKRTRSIGTTTAVQACENELFGTGFTVDWNVLLLPDWSMPNASYSYQELTPLQAIKRIASTVGAVVQPAMADDELIVRPRFAVLPWNLWTADMDRTIHENHVLSESGSLETHTLINAVFVSGEREGVALSAVRQGTAGDEPGADIVDAWLTAQEANVSRAAQEMAASGNREIHTLEMAVPESNAQPGLLVPGLTVAVVHGDDDLNYRGYVRGVSIKVPGRGSAKVRQTVTIDRPVGWEVV